MINSRNINGLLNCWGILFLLAAFGAALMGYKEFIPDYMLFMHFLIGVLYFMGLKISLHIHSRKGLYSLVFIYTLFISVVLRYLFWTHTGDPFGDTEGCDSYKYEAFVLQFRDMDFPAFVRNSLRLSVGNIDDMGYTSIVYFIYQLFSDMDATRNLLLVINAVAITVSAIYIYKLCIVLGIRNRVAMFASALYGFFPFFCASSAVGLKENLFCVLIVCSIYYMYRYKSSRSFGSLLLALFFIAATYFFRFAICIMLCLTFVTCMVSSSRNRSPILLLAVIAGMIFLASLEYIMYQLAGISMSHIYLVADSRMERSGGSGIVGWIVHGSAAFFGPFPNFNRLGQYGFYYSSGLLLKCLFGIFAFVGSLSVLKRFEYRYYPIVLFLFMGIFMLLGSGTSLDIRYHITSFSAFVILAAYCLDTIDLRKYVFYIYVIVSCAVVVMYNLR